MNLLDNATLKAIVDKLMILFSRYGIPDTFITDSEPQFTSLPMTSFVKEWSFRHITSSPNYPRSNGKAESAVNAKSIMTKCTADGSYVWRAILDWRNTPTDGVGSSPSQRLMSRRTRMCLPTAFKMLRPRVITGVQDKLLKKRDTTKKYYDRGTKKLFKLSLGQPVRIKLPSGNGKRWTQGTCLGQVAPQSYTVQTKYDRQMIRPAPDLEKFSLTPSMYTDTEPDDPVAPSDQGSSSGASQTDSEPDSPEASDDAVTLPDQSLLSSGPSTVDPSQAQLLRESRSGRKIRLPLSYRQDCVT